MEDATDLDELLTRQRRLSPREREIMQLMTKGMATKEIARVLNISPRTVDNHRSRIMHKMGTNRLAALVRMAVKIESNS